METIIVEVPIPAGLTAARERPVIANSSSWRTTFTLAGH